MISLRLYLDSRAVKKGEPCPIKLMLNHRSKTALLPLGVSVLPYQWDAKSQQVVNSPSRDSINAYLLERRATVQNLILRMTSSGELLGLSITEVKRKIEEALSPTIDRSSMLEPRFEDFISRCKAKRTREIYQATLRKVQAFEPHASSLRFEAVTKDWLSRFDSFLADSGCKSLNARAIHLRNLRAVFNDAIDNGVTSVYPFRKFKIKTEATAKRSLSVEQLRSLFSCEVLPWQRRYLDVFKLTFFLIGINTIDLLALKKSSVTPDGRLQYRRAKTSRLYSIKLEPEALELIHRYRGIGHLLSFGDAYKDSHAFCGKLDRGLKSIGHVEHVPNPKYSGHGCGHHLELTRYSPLFPFISIYWARHTWASVAAELDVPVEVIAHALGHGFGNRTTAIYIDFDLRKVDAANRRVMDWVLYGKH